jgi:MFS family permease
VLRARADRRRRADRRGDAGGGVRLPVSRGGGPDAVPPTARGGALLREGWAMVGALAVTETVSYGVLTFAFPVVLEGMQTDLGGSQPLIMGAFSMAALVAGGAAFLIGRWIDRHGPRGIMTIGSIAASLLVAAWSRVDSPLGLYLVWLGIGPCMAALSYEPAFAAVVRWGPARRARAFAIITGAGSTASTIFVPLTAALTARYGWRGAVACLAAILALTTIAPHGLLVRGPRLRAAQGAGGPRACRRPPAPAAASPLRSPSLRWLAAAVFLSSAANVALALHLVPLLLGQGLTLTRASAALAILGAAKLLGRLTLSLLAARFTTAGAMGGLFLVQTVGLLALLLPPDGPALWWAVVLFGMGDGASTPARASLIGELHGDRGYGTIGGALGAILAGARVVAPVGASLVLTGTGDLRILLAVLAAALLGAAACLRRAAAPGDLAAARAPHRATLDPPLDRKPASRTPVLRLPG